MSCAGTLMTPRIDAKIRRKLLHSRFKRPDFKDILRQRFKNRIRENRSSLLEKIRSTSSSDEVQDTLSDYMMQELDGIDELDCGSKTNSFGRKLFGSSIDEQMYLEQELTILESIQKELMEEEISWIREEYRKEEEEIQALMVEKLTCPICKRGCLQKVYYQDPITCTVCNLRLSSLITLEQVNLSLRLNLNEHSQNCGSDPKFGVINELHASSLLITCNDCSFFSVIS